MGVTMIGAALNYTTEKGFRSQEGDRPNAKNVLIVITDGLTQDDLDEAARKASNVAEVFAIGITNYAFYDMLLEIAGRKRDHVIRSKELRLGPAKAIKQILKVLGEEDCASIVRDDLPGTAAGESLSSLTSPSGGMTLPTVETVEVSCGSDHVNIAADSDQPFTGNVYAKGHYREKECKHSFADNTGKYLKVTFKTDACGMVRSRTGEGVYTTLIIIFMSHPMLLTKFDRAFKIQCFYMNAEKTVTQQLDVSMLNTEMVSTLSMPSCEYTLHANDYNGPLVRHAVLGSRIVHRWDCRAPMHADIMFGFKVYNCYARDGSKNNVLILDKKGCPLDKYVMPELTYTNDLMTAYVDTMVFKFADIQDIRFDCQIQICVKMACGGITPPKCAAPRKSRSVMYDPAEDFDDGIIVSSPSIDVIGDFLNRTSDASDTDVLQQRSSSENKVCMSQLSIALGTSSYAVLLMMTSVFFFVSYRIRMKKFDILDY